jgi:hypothetical protein
MDTGTLAAAPRTAAGSAAMIASSSSSAQRLSVSKSTPAGIILAGCRTTRKSRWCFSIRNPRTRSSDRPPAGKVQHRQPPCEIQPRHCEHLPEQHAQPPDIAVDTLVGKWKPLDHAARTIPIFQAAGHPKNPPCGEYAQSKASRAMRASPPPAPITAWTSSPSPFLSAPALRPFLSSASPSSRAVPAAPRSSTIP